jgi:hypothetical protein
MRTLLGLLVAGLLVLAGCGDADRPRGDSPAVGANAPARSPVQNGGTIEV